MCKIQVIFSWLAWHLDVEEVWGLVVPIGVLGLSEQLLYLNPSFLVVAR